MVHSCPLMIAVHTMCLASSLFWWPVGACTTEQVCRLHALPTFDHQLESFELPAGSNQRTAFTVPTHDCSACVLMLKRHCEVADRPPFGQAVSRAGNNCKSFFCMTLGVVIEACTSHAFVCVSVDFSRKPRQFQMHKGLCTLQ